MFESRLKTLYKKDYLPKLKKDLGYNNVMELPKISKVVLNISSKEAVKDSKVVDRMLDDLFVISGQQPVVTRARASIASFKLREGAKLGCKVTLRDNIMYNFIDRLVNIALPRMKDFRGISDKQFDGLGNFSMGIKEQIIFPEVNYDKIDSIRGMNIVIITTAKTNKEAKALLEYFNFPFKR